jgi:hypothetical protein
MAIMNPSDESRRARRLTVCMLGFGLASLVGARWSNAAPEAKQIRVKNGRTVRVVLGARREHAVGIRPEKDKEQDRWLVVLAPDMAGSSAELQDITPDVSGSRWVMPVSGDRLVLDAERFLPSHVYRVAFRRDGQLLGTVLVYLYPPPAERVGRADFRDDETAADKSSSSSLATTPKGDLSHQRDAGRPKPR